jgi:hypothetical protein
MTNRRWEQVVASGGIVFVLLQLGAQSLIQIGGIEPSFDAPAEQALQFFAGRNDTLFPIGGYLSTLSFIALIGFLGVLWNTLRTAEGPPGALAFVALGSGLVLAAVGFAGQAYWGIAWFRAGDGLSPEIAAILFDLGNFTFAASWVLAAGLVLATGAVALRTGVLPGWLGWYSVAVGLGLLAARAVWTSPVAFAPYLLYWVWLIAVSVVLIRRAGSRGHSSEAGETAAWRERPERAEPRDARKAG